VEAVATAVATTTVTAGNSRTPPAVTTTGFTRAVPPST